ncbi:MAG: hypothetical protein KF716_22295 [Anaerolineae bacterium]|nr:hypothetical protein [Anaerolineae bacterium]
MNDVFQIFGNAITKIFPENRIGQIALLIVVATIAIGCGWAWNSLTGDFTLRRLEKQISLLKELNELNQANVSQSTELQPIYTRLTAELRDYNPSLQVPNDILSNPRFLQFFGAGWIWFTMAFFMIFIGNPKLRERLKLAAGTFIAGLLIALGYVAIYSALGILGLQPSNSILDFIIPTMLLIVLLGLFVHLSNKRVPNAPITPNP